MNVERDVRRCAHLPGTNAWNSGIGYGARTFGAIAISHNQLNSAGFRAGGPDVHAENEAINVISEAFPHAELDVHSVISPVNRFDSSSPQIGQILDIRGEVRSNHVRTSLAVAGQLEDPLIDVRCDFDFHLAQADREIISEGAAKDGVLSHHDDIFDARRFEPVSQLIVLDCSAFDCGGE